ncbi:hypothetical protein ACFQ23_07565 [Schaalia naturae]|jgi:hypothetical protein|uniref:Uncharacterized protein n=1 Tax=Schaalia naturae TaxID=635203 RepID=A0ABW2SNY2_9ACTO
MTATIPTSGPLTGHQITHPSWCDGADGTCMSDPACGMEWHQRTLPLGVGLPPVTVVSRTEPNGHTYANVYVPALPCVGEHELRRLRVAIDRAIHTLHVINGHTEECA